MQNLIVIFLLTIILKGVQIHAENPDDEDSGNSELSRMRKRSVFLWPQSALFNSLNVQTASNYYKPATSSISGSYFIPVYGIRGGNLIYYPPQPIYINAGNPIDNPSPSLVYQGPEYLPPKKNDAGNVNNRFGEDNDDDDDRPIWGSVDEPQQMPLSAGGNNKENSIIPTRPPAALEFAQTSSLIHDDDQISGNIKENNDASGMPQQGKENSTPVGPSNCVWAIISCCSAANPNILPHNCFEQRGCPGPFWGISPCHGDFARTAIASALEYYSQNS